MQNEEGRTESQQREAGVAREEIVANLRAWIHDLRTTDAKQGQEALYSDNGYCCLGRAIVTLGGHVDTDKGCMVIHGQIQGGWLDGKGASLLGLTPDDQRRLAHMNDGYDDNGATAPRKTFPEIADWLEANILPRHTEPVDAD